MFDEHGHRRKLIVFTEHRDTLVYLARRMRTLLGRENSVVTIHGGMGREDRRKAQDIFTQDKDVEILVATDAAGEGINLQRAHLMVNYDLPWNPNRLEQRFGRIHRIGQTEVCHLWNLVAEETREGDVYLTLLKKLEAERNALGGAVFDVLGKAISGKELRRLLIEAIRYGDRADVKARLSQVVERVLDRKHLCELIEDGALVKDSMDVTKVMEIRQEMERDPAVIVMGEDVAGGAGRPEKKDAWGGPMRLTKGLIHQFGEQRVRDTPISEAGFIGAGVGAAATGLRPVVELMYVGFLGVCADQILNNTAKMHYMFGGKVNVPLTIMTTIGAGLNAPPWNRHLEYSLKRFLLTHFRFPPYSFVHRPRWT